MKNGRWGCINRDNNAVKNMIKIVLQFLIDKERPLRYRRDYKLPEDSIETVGPLANIIGPIICEAKPLLA